MSRSRYKIVTKESAPYFISCSVVNWIPVFSNPAIANIIFDSLSFLHKQQRLTLHAYVLMENHLHLIVSSPNFSNEMRNFKFYTAGQCIKWYQERKRQWMLEQLQRYKNRHKIGQKFQFWQEGFHPKLIQDEAMLRNKLEYIHNNPVERGYIDDPIDWRYSSYRNYIRGDGILAVDKLI
jgi:REP element-mobilizing transposase RayT